MKTSTRNARKYYRKVLQEWKRNGWVDREMTLIRFMRKLTNDANEYYDVRNREKV